MQAMQIAVLLVSNRNTKDILHQISLLHPGYGYDTVETLKMYMYIHNYVSQLSPYVFIDYRLD